MKLLLSKKKLKKFFHNLYCQPLPTNNNQQKEITAAATNFINFSSLF